MSVVAERIAHLAIPVASARDDGIVAGLRVIDDRLVGWFEIGGDDLAASRGLGCSGADTVARTVRSAADAGVPVVGVLHHLATDAADGIAALHGFGRIARAVTDASGVVPLVMVVAGPCAGAGALLLGLADVVIATPDAVGVVSGPGAVAAWTARHLGPTELGGAEILAGRAGVAHLLAADVDQALHLALDVLSFLPANNLDVPPRDVTSDPVDRDTDRAAAAIPTSAQASYDVRDLIADIVDHGEMVELGSGFAPNLVTGLARLGGAPVGVVATQPCRLAGTIDIHASQKGARFVQWCDAFGLGIVTFVDTPGFQPGKELEWQGMIRKGAQLAHAYAAATVPRICVITRKAYGGAYIVLDAKTMGSDLCLAWPTAEIAVMGASGAVEILHRRQLAAIVDDGERSAHRARLESRYADEFLNPHLAAARGFVDAVIQPADTRRAIALALGALANKRERLPRRRHANPPL